MRDLALNRILQGNALDRLRGLPESSVHCVVTSPPYWSLRDYQIEGQLGLEATPQKYVERMVEVFREVHRVLRPDGTLWLNMGDCYATGAGSFAECPGGGKQGARWRGDVDRLRDDKRGYRGERLANGRGDQPAVLRKKTVGRGAHTAEHAGKQAARVKAMGPMDQPNRMPIPGLKPKDLVGMPWRLAFALQADGWWLRSDIIWQKLNPMPESVTDRPTKAHEYVFLLSRSERYYYDSEAIREPDHNTDHPRRCEEEIDRTQPGVSPHRGLRTVDGRNGLGRNKRTVWTIATSPFPEAHFATYPQELVEPCVLAGTSERGCCSSCGAPYVRRMERQAYGAWHNHENDLTEGNRQNRDSLRMRNGRELAEQYVAPRTVGWDKTCACDAKTTVPGIILDPFMGSGTTALVALRAGRKFIGIELNEDYIKIANKRIEQEAAQARMF